MSRWQSLVVAAGGLAAADPVSAQAIDPKDRAFVEAMTVVVGYDVLATRCSEQASFTSAELEKSAAWQRDNAIDALRGQVRLLARSPATEKAIEQARAAFAQRFASVQGRDACTSAISLTQLPDAQLATKSPQLLAALRLTGVPTSPTAAAPVARGTAAAAAPSAPTTAGRATDDALVRRIDAFGFDTRAEMGMGGFIGLKVYPVVLFRDGAALTDVEGLGFADGIDGHRRANPDDWTQWRRQGTEIQLLKKGTWTKLAFSKTYSTLPSDFRLDGRFRRSSGVGNVAIGGSSSVTVVNQYLFSPDGRVVRDGAFGSTSSAGDMSAVTSGASPDKRGRYSISGITLRIRYDDGSEERRILVTDPTDPKSVIWLDGNGYVRR